MFAELAPKDSEAILYLLPWLLSVNHQRCPGYIAGMKNTFRVYNIGHDMEIRKREKTFKRRFGIRRKGSLLGSKSKSITIQGVYTIGSVGTVSQTSASDCDIWVCCEKSDFDMEAWNQLNQKINLIKDWMDITLRMPVFFFLCDVEDIRESRFGSVDAESAGSTQKNVLKEEFYRTCIIICGKIPLWWVSYHPRVSIPYEEARQAAAINLYGHYDLIDFGDLKAVEKSEYFGTALWHLHKSLETPLKSIIKMLLLKILLDAPHQLLICHQFRERVLGREKDSLFLDPSIFAMSVILNYFTQKRDEGILAFLKECFYLRCRIRPYDRKNNLKKELTTNLFKNFPIDIKRRIHLGKFDTWPFDEQVRLGQQLFQLLMRLYREIADAHTGIASQTDIEDLSVLGRKISACYEKKEDKIKSIQKPATAFNVSTLRLRLEGEIWYVFSDNERREPIVSHPDIVHTVAFIVWNNLFESNNVSMDPNPSQVTVQEVINLGKKMKDFLGVSRISRNEFSNYMKKEFITKLLIVISFAESNWKKNLNHFNVVYTNSWGELFTKRINSFDELDSFLKSTGNTLRRTDISYYLQRNCMYYEKIIERTKKSILTSIL